MCREPHGSDPGARQGCQSDASPLRRDQLLFPHLCAGFYPSPPWKKRCVGKDCSLLPSPFPPSIASEITPPFPAMSFHHRTPKSLQMHGAGKPVFSLPVPSWAAAGYGTQREKAAGVIRSFASTPQRCLPLAFPSSMSPPCSSHPSASRRRDPHPTRDAAPVEGWDGWGWLVCVYRGERWGGG